MADWLSIIDQLYEGSWDAHLRRFRSRYAFRGMNRADSTLSSTLLRLAGGHRHVRRLELALIRNFRKYAHTATASTDSIWHWLALGQHCGLPTRLLDWTYSPLVALHFATDHLDEFEHDGVVWCVDFVAANRRLPRRLRALLDSETSDTLTVEMLGGFDTFAAFDRLASTPFVVFMEPPAIDRRILNQHALFSLMSSPTARLDEWLHANPDLFRRVTIPAAAKWEIRDKLDQANINERILFPSLEGLCRWLGRYYMPPPPQQMATSNITRFPSRSARAPHRSRPVKDRSVRR